MNTLFPQFCHKRKYDNYYLFTDTELFLENDFKKNFYELLKLYKIENIIIEVENTFNYVDVPSTVLINVDNFFLRNFLIFYETEINIEGEYILLKSFPHRIFDVNYSFELYYFEANECGILGNVNKINNYILKYLKPYEQYSLNSKLKEITLGFENKDDSNNYIENLLENYVLTK